MRGSLRGTTADAIWGDGRLLARCGWIPWSLCLGLSDNDKDVEKLETILLIAMETYLWMPSRGYANDNAVAQMVGYRVGVLAPVFPTEQGRLATKGRFISQIQGLLRETERWARERQKDPRNARKHPPTVLSLTNVLSDAIAEELSMFMWNAGRSGSTGMDAWNGWLGLRGGTTTRKTDDSYLTNWIARRLDWLIWTKIRRIKKHSMVPVEMGFLGYYLRMEGMRERPNLLPDETDERATYRRRMRLHMLVRKACVLHLGPTLKRCPDTRQILEQDGLEVVVGTTYEKVKLRYRQQTGLGTIHTWELELNMDSDDMG